MQPFNKRVTAVAENKKNLRDVQLYTHYNKRVVCVLHKMNFVFGG